MKVADLVDDEARGIVSFSLYCQPKTAEMHFQTNQIFQLEENEPLHDTNPYCLVFGIYNPKNPLLEERKSSPWNETKIERHGKL